MRSKFIGLWIGIGISICTHLHGQTIQSPYSSYGIGEVQPKAVTGNVAMGGIGIGGGHAFFLNTRNSAWLARNGWTTFDIGLEGDYRTINTASSFNELATGGLRNIAFGFPILRKTKVAWTASAGMMPYSTVSYRIRRDIEIPGEIPLARYSFEGSGGYNQVFWGNGVRVGNNLFLGVKGSFIFGSVTKESTSGLLYGTDTVVATASNVTLNERSSVRDFNWEASLGYQIGLQNDITIRLGATYEAAAQLNTSDITQLQIRNGFNVSTSSDTIQFAEGLTQSVPFSLGTGVAIEKSDNWIIGVDFDYQPWSQFRDVRGNSHKNLVDQWRVSLGSQYTPSWNAERFLQRIGYSAGVHFENMPIFANNQQLTDFGINFGVSLPVSRTGSTLNMAMQLGNRGTVDAELIRENYVKLNLGVSFNQLWFIRSKYD